MGASKFQHLIFILARMDIAASESLSSSSRSSLPTPMTLGAVKVRISSFRGESFLWREAAGLVRCPLMAEVMLLFANKGSGGQSLDRIEIGHV